MGPPHHPADEASDLLEQKALLDSILESSQDRIFAKDVEGRYLLVNRAEAVDLGREPEDFVGLTDAELFTPAVAAENRRKDREVLASGRGQLYEQDFESPSGGKRTFLVRKSPLLGKDGKPRGVVGIARDVTALKRAEADLRQTQKLEGLGVLAGGIAHDFNNLLTGILGNASLALEGAKPGTPLFEQLRGIHNAAIRASELTHQMLAYSGKSEFKKKVLYPPDLVRDVGQLVASAISKKAQLVFDVSPSVPNVEADPAQMQQILMNLLTNASEALGERPGKITVGIRPFEVGCERGTRGPDLPDGSYVLFWVTDSGCGMRPATIDRIFDPFYTTKFSGRGLGLAAVRGIVHSHGGAIEVESEVGVGTTFQVYLPATHEPVGCEPPCEEHEAWRAQGTVLVADDEESVLSVMVRVLERASLRVLTATDGLEAVEIFRRSRDEIRAVILDLTTPRLDGFEAFERMRAIDPRVQVILTSGYAEAHATRGLEGRGLAGFLKKPFQPAELISAVRSVLE